MITSMGSVSLSLSRPTLASHLRALYAIAQKDWHQFWRYPLNVVGFVIQPLAFLTPVYFMGLTFSINGQAAGFAAYSGSGDYISFILLGSLLGNYVMTVFWGMGYALKNDMDSGVLESTWLTPTPRVLLLVGRTFTNLLTTTIISLATLLLAALLFGFRPTGSALEAVLPAIPMLIGLYGFGIAFAAVVLMMRDANTLVDVSSYLVNLFSGSQFPVQSLPRFLLPIALALPLTYGYDAVRGFLLRTRTIIPIGAELAILVIFMIVMVWIGVRVFNHVERIIRARGTLGQH
ncbi:MAG: ABC transporter permease [Chloroflexi bacterium]|nr:ABC transporter permease [Chloroflexota bacterium]